MKLTKVHRAEYKDGTCVEVFMNCPVDMKAIRRLNRWIRVERKRCVQERLAKINEGE